MLTVVVAALVSFGTFKIMLNGLSPTEKNESKNFFDLGAGNKSTQANAERPEFVTAAELVIQSIVHIKVQVDRSPAESAIYPPFYGEYRRPAPVLGSGSGVIYSSDGYIITNNHVIDGAIAIQVILTDKRIFEAKLVGADPNTDLAVLKIDVKGLKPIQTGNSDAVRVGDWVLAAGYPFSLNTTVTAGIVSATGRNIGIIGQQDGQEVNNSGVMGSAVEAFIQTDAAINPGNSGGALVNTNGQLIGINAAIASQSGSYEGYGFAIPVNLTTKIVKDLIKYGEVKRGLLGVNFPSPATEDQFLMAQGIKPGSIQGAYIADVQPNSAAGKAGLQAGDIIQAIDESKVNSSVALSERIARHHPGDKIKLQYKRRSQTLSTEVVLQAQSPAPKASQRGAEEIARNLGATFAPLSEEFKQRYGMSYGLAITAVSRGGLFAQIGLQRGGILLTINGNRISSVGDISDTFQSATNGILRFECLSADGSRLVFNLSFGA